MTHTKEPWRANHANAGKCGYEVAGGDKFLNQVCDDVREDNARRIVACVNALDGLSNDALEGGWNFKEMSAYAKTLEEELASYKRMFNRSIRELAEITELCGGDENAIAIDCVKDLLAARQA